MHLSWKQQRRSTKESERKAGQFSPFALSKQNHWWSIEGFFERVFSRSNSDHGLARWDSRDGLEHAERFQSHRWTFGGLIQEHLLPDAVDRKQCAQNLRITWNSPERYKIVSSTCWVDRITRGWGGEMQGWKMFTANTHIQIQSADSQVVDGSNNGIPSTYSYM